MPAARRVVGCISLVVGWGLLLAGTCPGAIALVFHRQRAESERLFESGTRAVGKVTRTDKETHTEWDDGHSRTITTYKVTYSFAAGAAPLSRTVAVDEAVYEMLAEGNPVPVVFDPADPSRSDLAQNEERATRKIGESLLGSAALCAAIPGLVLAILGAVLALGGRRAVAPAPGAPPQRS